MRSFEDNAKFHLAFSVTALRALGDNGEWSKLSSIWANLKDIFKNVGYTVLLNDVKKVKNRPWKSRACVPSKVAHRKFGRYLLQITQKKYKFDCFPSIKPASVMTSPV
jgi:hypothetical protein